MQVNDSPEEGTHGSTVRNERILLCLTWKCVLLWNCCADIVRNIICFESKTNSPLVLCHQRNGSKSRKEIFSLPLDDWLGLRWMKNVRNVFYPCKRFRISWIEAPKRSSNESNFVRIPWALCLEIIEKSTPLKRSFYFKPSLETESLIHLKTEMVRVPKVVIFSS